MDVSVIIVNFNGRELLGDCLASIPPGCEVILVDNGSRDGSADFVQSAHPSAILVRNPDNRGFAKAVNQGIDRARGKYVLLLNPDARILPGAIDELVRRLESRPDVGIVAPQLEYADGRRQHSFDADPSLSTTFLNKTLLRAVFPKRFPSKRQEYREDLEVENVIGAAMMIRAETIRKVGKLDEDYFLYIEETDFCRRARRAGWKVLFVPSARVVHLQGKLRAKVAVRAKVEYVRSLFTFFRKHRPGSYVLVRILYPFKNLFELTFLTLGNALTLFLVPRMRKRFVETVVLLAWQSLFCPRGFGLG